MFAAEGKLPTRKKRTRKCGHPRVDNHAGPSVGDRKASYLKSRKSVIVIIK